MSAEAKDRKLVAVYGTLMTGEANERWAREAGAKVVATGTVRGRILDTGYGYPIIRLGGDSGRVRVEVLETDSDGIAHMDVLEGYPRLYGRETVLVENDDEAATGALAVAFDALIYAPQNPMAFGDATGIAPGADGIADWREYRRGKEAR